MLHLIKHNVSSREGNEGDLVLPHHFQLGIGGEETRMKKGSKGMEDRRQNVSG